MDERVKGPEDSAPAMILTIGLAVKLSEECDGFGFPLPEGKSAVVEVMVLLDEFVDAESLWYDVTVDSDTREVDDEVKLCLGIDEDAGADDDVWYNELTLGGDRGCEGDCASAEFEVSFSIMRRSTMRVALRTETFGS